MTITITCDKNNTKIQSFVDLNTYNYIFYLQFNYILCILICFQFVITKFKSCYTDMFKQMLFAVNVLC